MLSKEDLRKRRLAALCDNDDKGSNNSNGGNEAKMTMSRDSSQQKLSTSVTVASSQGRPPQIMSLSSPSTTTESSINEFLSLMWGTACSPEDQERWYNQGINFSNDGTFRWGLVQQFGGPCGVLACVQAELLHLVLFDPNTSITPATLPDNDTNLSTLPQLQSLSELKLEILLAKAIACLLVRACTTNNNASKKVETYGNQSVKIVIPKYTGQPLLELNESFIQIKYVTMENQAEVDNLTEQISNYLLNEYQEELPGKPLSYFQQPGGVVLLVCSMVLSRGPSQIKADMDDPLTCHLTGQFGHCSQELINLFLTGSAVSNVFDNMIDMGGGYVLNGIPKRPNVGYLTQLEALRYCEVGSYFKTPLSPIWVIGSSSHFSILFGTDPTCIEQSKSDELLDKCRRAFRVSDSDSNGFIQVLSLAGVLNALDPDIILKIGGENGLQALAAKLEVSGAGIILWDDFWKTCSRLMTGASLQNVIVDDTGGQQGRAKDDSSAVVASPIVMESDPDEQYARAVQAQFDNETAKTVFDIKGHMNDNISSQGKSDEELARELQAKFDNGVFEDESSLPPLESISPAPENDDNASTTALADGRSSLSMSDNSVSLVSIHNPITLGDTFSLFYYNGLRGGILQHFDVTRLTSEEAIGASIALNSGSGVGADGGNHNNALEDVVRTRWPSCAFNWQGKAPPAID